jgi:hypothetical protein
VELCLLGLRRTAIEAGQAEYRQLDYIIRAKLFAGIRDGRMKIGSIYKDEREKLVRPQTCAYCGSMEAASIDHLIPRVAGGRDDGHNLILACRSCNSSKGGRDLLEWYASRQEFPPLTLLRRYLKLLAAHCVSKEILDLPIAEAAREAHPFRIDLVPVRYPPPGELHRWPCSERHNHAT